MSWRDHYKVHPSADIFPLLRETKPEQFADLVDDIKTHGLVTPITLWTDENGEQWLLDGRNRMDALEAAGVPLTDDMFQVENGAIGNPARFVISSNIRRRHLKGTALTKFAIDTLKAIGEVDPNLELSTKATHEKGRRGAKKGLVGKVASLTGQNPHTAARHIEEIKAAERGEKPKRLRGAPSKREVAQAADELAMWIYERVQGDAELATIVEWLRMLTFEGSFKRVRSQVKYFAAGGTGEEPVEETRPAEQPATEVWS
jgi:hypothetical protein